MTTHTPAMVQLDIGEAFGFVFRSRNWFGKLAVGALCLLFFWVFLIPLFILFGYGIETARSISQGERELPAWTDLGTKLKEGFLLGVALCVWGLPGAILSSGSGVQCVQSSCTYHAGALAPLGTVYSMLLGLLTAAIWSQFLEGGIAAAFDFRVIFRRALEQPGLTVVVWLMAIAAAIIGGLGVVLIALDFSLHCPTHSRSRPTCTPSSNCAPKARCPRPYEAVSL